MVTGNWEAPLEAPDRLSVTIMSKQVCRGQSHIMLMIRLQPRPREFIVFITLYKSNTLIALISGIFKQDDFYRQPDTDTAGEK